MLNINQILPAIRMSLSTDVLVSVNLSNSPEILEKCNSENIEIEGLFYALSTSPEQLTEEIIEKALYMPFGICVKGLGLIVVAESAKTAKAAKSYFEAALLGNEIIPEKLSSDIVSGKVKTKIFIVTGGAQGFGEGIVRDLYKQGANIVIADLNDAKANELASELNASGQGNMVTFFKTNVAEAASVEALVEFTVKEFGGLDVMISNAGILRAGGLDEMTPETFDLMTKVNYTGYFMCAKYASAVMKTQNRYKPDHFTDIIQINSKSGLKGSNKNFAYAGGKFGGIGLTQSWAMELMPYNVKVNSICPGNFFDGPLWSDPQNGLFVQYLNAGKVPGAKTINDVKRFYEAQVPANRGCRVIDVMRAIYYVIEQEYETGQAIPVTGGQNMLK